MVGYGLVTGPGTWCAWCSRPSTASARQPEARGALLSVSPGSASPWSRRSPSSASPSPSLFSDRRSRTTILEIDLAAAAVPRVHRGASCCSSSSGTCWPEVRLFEATYAERAAEIQGGIEKAELAQAEAAEAPESCVAGAVGRCPRGGQLDPRGGEGPGGPDHRRNAGSMPKTRPTLPSKQGSDRCRTRVVPFSNCVPRSVASATSLAGKIVGESLDDERAGAAYGRPVHRRSRGEQPGGGEQHHETRLGELDLLLDPQQVSPRVAEELFALVDLLKHSRPAAGTHRHRGRTADLAHLVDQLFGGGFEPTHRAARGRGAALAEFAWLCWLVLDRQAVRATLSCAAGRHVGTG